MRLTLGRSKFKIRILYKSGASHSQWFTEFTATVNNDNSIHRIKWNVFDQNIQPIHMNVDNVDAIYQEDYRINLFYCIYINTIGYFIK